MGQCEAAARGGRGVGACVFCGGRRRTGTGTGRFVSGVGPLGPLCG